MPSRLTKMYPSCLNGCLLTVKLNEVLTNENTFVKTSKQLLGPFLFHVRQCSLLLQFEFMMFLEQFYIILQLP